MKTFATKNPFTGATLAKYDLFDEKMLEEKLVLATEIFRQWSAERLSERARLVREVGSALRQKKTALAELMTREMGKPIRQSLAEIEKCAATCEYYAEKGIEFLSDQRIQSDARVESFVSFQPLGPILAVMPWNFPFWQVIRCLVPSLMAGNTVLLKHATNTTGCALALEELVAEVANREGLLTVVLADHIGVERLIGDFRVRAVSFTGSTEAGRSIARTAGQALKKCVLELGGSDAYVVLEDADLKTAVRACVEGRMINTGQSCIAAKRWIVMDRVFDEFAAQACDLVMRKIQGDPMDEKTDLGPLARPDLCEALRKQVHKSESQGAELILQNPVPHESNSFYPATVLSDVKPGMVAFEEELFGPVAVMIRAQSETEAMNLANQTAFGLGGAIFSQDIERAKQLARNQLEAGSCFVNAMVRSDARLPFGGTKDSGFGRELSNFGAIEFVNIKTVYIDS